MFPSSSRLRCLRGPSDPWSPWTSPASNSRETAPVKTARRRIDLCQRTTTKITTAKRLIRAKVQLGRGRSEYSREHMRFLLRSMLSTAEGENVTTPYRLVVRGAGRFRSLYHN